MSRLAIGIGCRRDSSAQQIANAVLGALGTYRLQDVGVVATLDRKCDTPGLLAFCAQHGLPLLPCSPAQINALPVAWQPSAAARAHVGVSGVCEPCALLAAPGGQLLVGKFRLDGVTVAIAAQIQDIHHEN
ncbi:Cobalt-precorrin-5A hydrolase [Andreprevotia sp. IGB-42]|uniref:cobalamin biosynthesis protein n=1 Tax=Andreprevotia sp. IGB-42 TaxID=2497473 RepID=UPI001359C47D|nr:cobalamin biosynthesis protein [Andreprevotia sp. IGB-42]KAF0813315.1 Cobalt-precorrin-5A hydrolase [Andreprevotia sp. IGB-42]